MSAARPTAPIDTDEGLDVRDALKLGAFVMSLLMALVLIRFSFNLCLDCSILDDREGALRRMKEFWRRLCPWWHVRTQPSSSSSTSPDSPRTITSSNPEPANSSALELATTTTSGLQHASESDLEFLNEILPSEKLTLEAIEELIQNNEQQTVEHTTGTNCDTIIDTEKSSEVGENNNNNNLLVCSICLHDLNVGDEVYRSRCQHMFHAICIRQWVHANNSKANRCSTTTRTTAAVDCPNCRTPLLR